MHGPEAQHVAAAPEEQRLFKSPERPVLRRFQPTAIMGFENGRAIHVQVEALRVQQCEGLPGMSPDLRSPRKQGHHDMQRGPTVG